MEVLAILVQRIAAACHAEEIWLFGSRARGDDLSDSDYDFLVVTHDGDPARDESEAYRAVADLGVGCDILACCRRDFDAGRQDHMDIVARAIREGRRVYPA